MSTKSPGWAWPMNLRKAHYFVEGRALCGGYMYLGGQLSDDLHDSPDNCKKCKEKRAKLAPKPEVQNTSGEVGEAQ